MNLAAHPAGENILFLDQGIELVRRLAPGLYTGCPDGPCRGGVGAQLRHCLDFYDSFLGGVGRGRIDYSRRRRDPEVERDPGSALARLRAVRAALVELESALLDEPIDVKSDEASFPGAAEATGRSSARRELHFLVSHTIHHYALIALLLHAQGFDVTREFPGFGVAPSTRLHWDKEAGSAAR